MQIADDADDYLKQAESMQLFDRMKAASQPSEINFVDNSVPDQVSKPLE